MTDVRFPTTPWGVDGRKTVVNLLEKDSDMAGIKNHIKGNGGSPDGKLGWNDLKAILDNGPENGVSDVEMFLAKTLMDHFNDFATPFGKEKYITA